MKKIRLSSFFPSTLFTSFTKVSLALILATLTLPSIALGQVIEQLENNSSTSVTTTTNRGSQRTNLETLEQRIYEIETEYDAYDGAIGELSFDLANALASLGRADEAHAAYRRALHVTRINSGLNAIEQIPILEAVLNLHTKAHELDESGDILHRLRVIHQDNYPALDPNNINMLERMGIWHLSAYYSRQDSKRIFHLIDASAALIEVQRLKKQTSAEYDYDLYRLISMSHFLLMRQKPTNSSSSSPFYSSSSLDSENERNQQQNPVDIAIEVAFRRTNGALDSGIEQAQKSQNYENITRAILLKADWNQLHNRRNTARALYLDAYNIAKTHLAPDNETRRSFEQPHELPMFSDKLLTFSTLQNSTDRYKVQISFDVSDWGVSSNVKRLDDENEAVPEPAKRTAVRKVRSSKYRPSIINGKTVDSVNVHQLITVNL